MFMSSLMISDAGNDEIKIFEYDKHEEDNSDRLSPVIKDEESPMGLTSDQLHHEQQFQYFLSPYYQPIDVIPFFDKMSSLSKFIPPPPPNINTVIPNSIYPLSYSQQPWRSTSNRRENNSQSKKSHIKKPLNAFMLFMKEQRSQVVQECTLRESAAINQILGRKWHELDRHVQQKYYDMARNERLKHMQLYPGWSARDNYGVKKKRADKGKKRDKAQECLNQKKCRARFGLEQQVHWCKHCKRKKKCLRYAENETTLTWSDEDDTDSNDGELILTNTLDSDEENKSRLLRRI